MSTITLKINEKTKAGKAFKDLIDALAGKPQSGFEIVQMEKKSKYNPEFVAELKVAEKRADYIVVDPKDVWGSIK